MANRTFNTMSKPKPEIGQVLYSLNVGNAARYKPQELTPATVTKVGRKYFTTGEGWQSEQYEIETWKQKTDFIASSQLYSSEQEWEDEKEARSIASYIENHFRHGQGYGAPLASLREIKNIIDNCKK